MSIYTDEYIAKLKLDINDFTDKVNQVESILQKLSKNENIKAPEILKDLAPGIISIKEALSETNKELKNIDTKNATNNVNHLSQAFRTLDAVAFTTIQNITNRLVNFGLHTVRQVSLAPIIDGFEEYETQINSTQTIMANTGRSVNDVTKALDDLNTYADLTIYNFSQMTSNAAMFTAAIGKTSPDALEKSTQAIKGIGNWAATAGANASDMARATYQLGQALSQGSIRLMDWRSLENTGGMAGANFQNAFFEAFKTLHPENADALQELINTKSFRESLSEGWLTNDVFFEAMKNFANDQSMVDNATKIKTLSQLIGTLKEQLGTGWASSFRIIFGNFEQAKNLWTSVGDVLLKSIGDMNQYRYELLKTWSDMGGRDALLKGLNNVFTTMSSILKTIKNSFATLFPPTTSQQLYDLTLRFEKFTEKIKLSDESLETFRKSCDITFTVLKFFIGIFKDLFVGIGYVIKPILNVIKSVLSFVPLIINGISNVNTSLQEFTIFSTVGKQIASALDIVVNRIIGALDEIKQKNITGEVTTVVGSLMNIFNNFHGFVNNMSSLIIKTFTNLVGYLLSESTVIISNIQQLLNLYPIFTFFNNLLSSISNLGGSEAALHVIDKIATGLGNLTKNIFSTVTDIDSLNKVLSYLIQWLEQIMQLFIYGNLARVFGNINSIFSGIASSLRFEKFSAYVESITSLSVAVTGLGETIKSLADFDTKKIVTITAALSGLLIVIGKIVDRMQKRKYEYGLQRATMGLENEAEGASKILDFVKKTFFTSFRNIVRDIQDLLESLEPMVKIGAGIFILSKSITEALNIFKDILNVIKSMEGMDAGQTAINVGILIGTMTVLILEITLMARKVKDVPLEPLVGASLMVISFANTYAQIAETISIVAKNDITSMIWSAVTIIGTMGVLMFAVTRFIKATDVAFFSLDLKVFTGFTLFFLSLSHMITNIAKAINTISAIGDIKTIIASGVVICGVFVGIIVATQKLVTQMSNNYVGAEKVDGLIKFSGALSLLFISLGFLVIPIQKLAVLPFGGLIQAVLTVGALFAGLYLMLSKIVETVYIAGAVQNLVNAMLALLPLVITITIICHELKNLATIPWQQLLQAVIAMGAVFAEILGSIWIFAKIKDFDAAGIASLGGFLFALGGIAGAIKTLSEIDPAALWIAIGALMAIFALIDAFYWGLTKVQSLKVGMPISQNKLIKTGIQIGGIVLSIIAIAIAISHLYKALLVMATIPTDKLLVASGAMIVVIGAIVGIAKAIEAIPFTGNRGIKKQLATIGVIILGLLPVALAMRVLSSIEIADSGKILVAMLSLTVGLGALYAAMGLIMKFTNSFQNRDSFVTIALISATLIALVGTAKIAASMSLNDVGQAILNMSALLGFVVVIGLVFTKIQVVSQSVERIAEIIIKFAQVLVAAFGTFVGLMGIIGQFGGEQVADQLLVFFDSIAGQQDRIRQGVSSVIDGVLNGVIDGIRNSLGNFIDLLADLFVEIGNKITQMDPMAKIVAGVLTAVVIGIVVAVKLLGNVVKGAMKPLLDLAIFFAAVEATIGALVAEAVIIAALIGQLLSIPFIQDGLMSIARTIGRFQGEMEGARAEASAEGLQKFVAKMAGISRYENDMKIAIFVLLALSDLFDSLPTNLNSDDLREIIDNMADYVTSLANVFKDVSTANVDINKVAQFGAALKSITDMLSSIQLSSNVNDLDAFLSTMGEHWAGSLSHFFETINTLSIDIDKIDSFSKALSILTSVTNINLTGNINDLDAYFSVIGEHWAGSLSGFFEMINGISIDSDVLSSFMDALNQLIEITNISLGGNINDLDAYFSVIGAHWAGSLSHFFEVVASTSINPSIIERFMGALKQLVEITNISLGGNINDLDAYFSVIGEHWAGSLSGFFEMINGISIDSDVLSSFMDALNQLIEITNISLGGNINDLDAYFSVIGEHWAGSLSHFFETVMSIKINPNVIERFMGALKQLVEITNISLGGNINDLDAYFSIIGQHWAGSLSHFFETVMSIDITPKKVDNFLSTLKQLVEITNISLGGNINDLDAYFSVIGEHWAGSLSHFFEVIDSTAINYTKIKNFSNSFKTLVEVFSSITPPANINEYDLFISEIGQHWTGSLSHFFEEIGSISVNYNNMAGFTKSLKTLLDTLSNTVPPTNLNDYDLFISTIGHHWAGSLSHFFEEIGSINVNYNFFNDFVKSLKTLLDTLSNTVPPTNLNDYDLFISEIGQHWAGSLTKFFEEISNEKWNENNINAFLRCLKTLMDALKDVVVPLVDMSTLDACISLIGQHWTGSLTAFFEEISPTGWNENNINTFLRCLKTLMTTLGDITLPSATIEDLIKYIGSIHTLWGGTFIGFMFDISAYKFNGENITTFMNGLSSFLTAMAGLTIPTVGIDDVDQYVSSIGEHWAGSLTHFFEEISNYTWDNTNITTFMNGLSSFMLTMSSLMIPEVGIDQVSAYINNIGSDWGSSFISFLAAVSLCAWDGNNITTFMTGFSSFMSTMSNMTVPNGNDLKTINSYIAYMGTTWKTQLIDFMKAVNDVGWNSANINAFSTGFDTVMSGMSKISVSSDQLSNLSSFITNLGNDWKDNLIKFMKAIHEVGWNSGNINAFSNGFSSIMGIFENLKLPESFDTETLTQLCASIGEVWTGALTHFMEEISNYTWNEDNINAFSRGFSTFMQGMGKITLPTNNVEDINTYVYHLGTNWKTNLVDFMTAIHNVGWNTANIEAFTTGFKTFMEGMANITIPTDGISQVNEYINHIGTDWASSLKNIMIVMSNEQTWDKANIEAFTTGLKAFLDIMSNLSLPADSIADISEFIGKFTGEGSWGNTLKDFMKSINEVTWNSENLSTFSTNLSTILGAIGNITIPDNADNPNAFSTLADDLIAMVNKLKDFVATYNDSGLSESFPNIITTINDYVDKITTAANNIKDAVSDDLVSQAKNNFYKLGEACWNGLKEGFGFDGNGDTSITGWFQNAAQTITDAANDKVTVAYSQYYTLSENCWNGLKEGFGFNDDDSDPSIITKFKDAIKTIAELPSAGSPTWNDTAKTNYKTLGENCAQGMIDGLNEKLDEVKTKAAELGSAAAQATADAAKVQSPSKVFMRIGEYCGEGFVLGIDNTVENIQNASERLANASINTLNDAIANSSNYTYHPIIQPLFDDSVEYDLKFKSNIQTQFSKPLDTLSDNLYGLYDRIQEDNMLLRSEIEQFRTDIQDLYNSDDSELSLYVDSKKLASTIAKPMNRQLNIIRKRGG